MWWTFFQAIGTIIIVVIISLAVAYAIGCVITER